MAAADMGRLALHMLNASFTFWFRHALPTWLSKASCQSDPSDGAAPGFDVPYISNGADEIKIGAADFRQRPLSCHA
jgi:hypothetical protein